MTQINDAPNSVSRTVRELRMAWVRSALSIMVTRSPSKLSMRRNKAQTKKGEPQKERGEY